MDINERGRKFSAIIEQVNKQYGSKNDGPAVFHLGDKPSHAKTVSTGSPSLDAILGGGLAQGRIIEIYGPEASGKTSIALTAVGNIQRQGGTALYVDSETTLDPRYAAILGVDVDKLAVSQMSLAEQTMDMIRAITATGAVDIIVIDSIPALIPQAEADGDASTQTVGLIARILSRQLRILVALCAKTDTTLLFINQIRDKISAGGMPSYGPTTTTPGGRAMKFYATQRIEVRKVGQITETVKGEKRVIGTKVSFSSRKNKIWPPYQSCESVLSFEHGISVAAEMLEVGPGYGVVSHKPGSRTYVETSTGEVIGSSKADAIDRLNANPEMLARMSEALKANVSGVVDQSSPVAPAEAPTAPQVGSGDEPDEF